MPLGASVPERVIADRGVLQGPQLRIKDLMDSHVLAELLHLPAQTQAPTATGAQLQLIPDEVSAVTDPPLTETTTEARLPCRALCNSKGCKRCGE